MSACGARLVALILGFMVTSVAHSQGPPQPFSNLRATPNPAAAGTVVSARLFFTYECLAGHPPTVEVQGSVVTMRQDYSASACGIVPPAPTDFDQPLGTFGPGEYTLVYAATRGNFVYPPLTTQFTILSGSSAAAVPATSVMGNLVLALMSLGVAWVAVSGRFR